jgi:chloramphenicol 3-O phosphotransferase
VFSGAVILNGGSSSGTSSIARALQGQLDEPWLLVGIDSFIESLPHRMRDAEGSIQFDPDGGIVIGDRFRTLERAWMAGVAATVRAGADVIVDDVFLSGGRSQDRWRAAMDGLPVRYVGVRCAGEVARDRESTRGDRVPGMAEKQAESVHEGVAYDLVVDTTATGSMTCAHAIVAYLADEGG